MLEQLSTFINAVEEWGSSYGFAFALLLAIVFSFVICFSFIFVRRIEEKLHDVSSNTKEKFANISRDIYTLDTGMEMILKDVKNLSNKKMSNIEKLITTATELAKDTKGAISEQHAYLYDKFSELIDKHDASGKDEHLSAEVLQKLGQIENNQTSVAEETAQKLEQIENNQTSVAEETAQKLGQIENDLSSVAAEIGQKIAQLEMETSDGFVEKMSARISTLEQKLEEIMENRLSGAIQFMDGLGEKISSLTATQEEIDKINKNVTQLSQLLSMSGADSAGAMARKRLGNLLAQSLPEEFYQLNATLQNDAVASALLCLPAPNSAVVIDAELSLESFFQSVDVNNLDEEARTQARENFHQETVERINFVADSLIVPPETGDSAFLFISAESAFAEIQAHHHEIVELAIKRRVWLVSPTTVIAIINTARAAVNDYQAQRQMKKMRETVAEILQEAQSFENRIIEISDHVNSAWRSVQRAEAAGGRFLGSVRDANTGFRDD